MKLSWILEGSLERKTGGTIYDAIVIDGLRRRGVAIDVRTPIASLGERRDPSVAPRSASSRSSIRGVAIDVRTPIASLGERRDPSAAPRSASPRSSIRGDAQRLVRELVRDPCDAIVGDELSFAALDIVFEHATFARRILLVHHLTCWEEERPPIERAWARRLESRVLRRADRVIATSATTRERLIAEGCRVPIDVARPGADRLPKVARAEFRSVSREMATAPSLDVLFVGAITARKRVLDLVHALHIAIATSSASPDARLTLIGDRDRDPCYVRAVDAAVTELGLGERVSFTGEVDEATLAKHLSRVDVFVLPSSLEGYGIAATEAIHAGVPVIAARTSGLVEALAPCGAAAMFVDDRNDLARAIRELTHDVALRSRMKEAATMARAKLPTWSTCVDAFHPSLAP